MPLSVSTYPIVETKFKGKAKTEFTPCAKIGTVYFVTSDLQPGKGTLPMADQPGKLS